MTKGYLATVTPEQRSEFAKKAAATRAARRQEARSQESEFTHAPTLDELLPQPAEESFVDDILTPEELAAEREAALAEFQRDRKARARKAARERFLDEIRHEAGDVSDEDLLDEEMREPTRVYINLPTLRTPTGNEIPPDPIIIDGAVFHQGTWHTVPRHQALMLHSMMALAFRHVAQVDGRSRTYYNRNLGTVVHQGGVAAGGSSAMPGFDALHKRPAR
jgi:hypothetical protein